MKTYRYELVVECEGDQCTAMIDGPGSPLRGHGSTPIEALTQLVATLIEWPKGGGERWLNTPAGTQLAKMFCPTFKPGPVAGPS